MRTLLMLALITIIYSQSTLSQYELKTFNEKLRLYVKSILSKKDYQESNQKLELPLKGEAEYISNIVPFSHIEYILRTTKYPKEVKDLINRAKTASPLYIINIEYSNLDIENKEFNEYIGVAFSCKEHVFYGLLISHVIEEKNSSDDSGTASREGYITMPPECWGCTEEEEKKMKKEYERSLKEEEEKKKKLILEAYISKSRKEMKKVIDSNLKI